MERERIGYLIDLHIEEQAAQRRKRKPRRAASEIEPKGRFSPALRTAVARPAGIP